MIKLNIIIFPLFPAGIRGELLGTLVELLGYGIDEMIKSKWNERSTTAAVYCFINEQQVY